MNKKWFPIIVVTVLALVLVGIKIYPDVYPIISNTFSNDSHSDANSNSDDKGQEVTNKDENNVEDEEAISHTEEHRNPLLEATFPFTREENEKFAKKHPDQFAIVNKMYYAWDYIDNVQGIVEYGDSEDYMTRTEFSVNFEKKKNRSKSERIEGGEVIETHNLLLKDNVAIRELVEENIYNESTPEDDRFESETNFVTQFLGMHHSAVTSSEFHTLIYDNYPDWTYEEGTKDGKPVYDIEGTIAKDKSNNLEGPFTMTVSKETGALLAFTSYDENNDINYFVRTEDIQINEGIENPDAVFQLDVSDDKEVSNKDYNLSGAGNLGENKTGWD